MRLATWNVNSIRAREERLFRWLRANQPDVLCLQELKVPDEGFPSLFVREAGYHAAVYGQKTYNGVAILSREEPKHVERGLGDDDPNARVISAEVGGLRIVSAYFPNGQVVGSDKWAYKLDWMQRLRLHLDREHAREEPLALLGDFNVAPEERDVAEPGFWAKSVLFHPEARRALAHVKAWGFEDAFRLHHEGGGFYTWWDYRRLAFPKDNGLRIDHVFLSPSLAARCTGARIDRDERKGKQPSDHAPVVVEIA